MNIQQYLDVSISENKIVKNISSFIFLLISIKVINKSINIIYK